MFVRLNPIDLETDCLTMRRSSKMKLRWNFNLEESQDPDLLNEERDSRG